MLIAHPKLGEMISFAMNETGLGLDVYSKQETKCTVALSPGIHTIIDITDTV